MRVPGSALPLVAALVGACTGGPVADTASPVDTSPIALRMVTLNAESGDADVDTVAEVVRAVRREALWGFTEVRDESWAEILAAAAADDGAPAFAHVLGTTGWSDRLALAWDDDVLELIDWEELHDINVGGSARAPLVGHFRIRDGDTELLVVVNHLWRTEAASRHEQAARLNTWGAAQTLPAITLGDFNFDWAVTDGDHDHDAGYDLLTADGVWTWIRPEELVMTQCNHTYESVLDFVFVAGEAQDWPAESKILQDQSSYCRDDELKTDHRPVRADLDLPRWRDAAGG